LKLTITVSGAFIGDELSYIDGPLAITIEDGVIVSIERHAEGVDLRGFIALPPLANMHVHALDLAIAEEGWDLDIDSVVGEPYGLKYILLKRLSRDELSKALESFYDYSLRCGVGLVVEFREFGVDGLKLGMRYGVNTYIMSMPPGHDVSINELSRLIELSDGFGISSPLYFSDDVLKAMLKLAKAKGKYVFAHIAEVREVRDEGDLEKLLRLGNPTAIVHGVWLSSDDVVMLRERGIPLILCPRSNRWFLSGDAKLDIIYREGIVIGLGTDNAGWVKPDLWRDAEEVLLRLRYLGINDPKWVLKALTVNAGNILGLRYELSEGVKANMLLLRNDLLMLGSVRNKYLAVVKRGGPELVGGVFIDGNLRYCSEEAKTLCNSLRDFISRR